MIYNIPNKQVEEKKRGPWFKRSVWFILILALMSVSFLSGLYSAEKNKVFRELATKEAVYMGQLTGKYSQAQEGRLGNDVDFSLFWDVWDTLKSEYVDKGKLSEKEMFYGAISGMTAAIGDPYTVFMDPKAALEFENDMAGTFEGIGAEIGMRDQIITVIAPLEDMPAAKAGIKAGDQIYAINGESTTGMSVDQAVQKIRGEKGTEVILTIYRSTDEGTKDYKITRNVITVKSVKTETISENTGAPSQNTNEDFYVLKITNFNNDTLELFNQSVADILKKKPKGIILDLRNNPGGYLDTAIEVASEWVEDGKIVTEQYGDQKKEDYLARGRARLADYPTVVLVNEGSASASEIVAGALKDTKKATIIGKKTFGKGSVQTLKQFSDGSSVKITVAKWLTPNGDCINGEGIKPDLEVDLKAEDVSKNSDPQMDKAKEELRLKIQG